MYCFFLQADMTFFEKYLPYNIFEMIIYVDVLFLENFFLDFIILLATGIICNNKIKVLKIVLASLIGSFFTIFNLMTNWNQMFLKPFISIIVLLIAFGWIKLKKFIKNLGVFYLTTITFGGASFMFLFLIKPEKIVYQTGHFLGYYPVQMSILRWNNWIRINNGCLQNDKRKIG